MSQANRSGSFNAGSVSRGRYGTSMFKGSARFVDPKPSPARDVNYAPPPGLADDVQKARYGRAWSQSSAPRFYNDELHRRPSTAGSEANYSIPTFVDSILKDKAHHGALFNTTSARFSPEKSTATKSVSGDSVLSSEETYQAPGLADSVNRSKHNPIVKQTAARFPKEAHQVHGEDPLPNADPNSIEAVASRSRRASTNASFGGTSARFREMASDGGLVSSRSVATNNNNGGAASLNASRSEYGTISAEAQKAKGKGTWAREKSPRLMHDLNGSTNCLSQTLYIPPSTLLIDSKRVCKFSRGAPRFHEPKRTGMADTVYNLPSFVDEILRK